MRIVIATNERGVRGGVETHLSAAIGLLVSRGHKVALLCERAESLPTVMGSPGELDAYWCIGQLGQRETFEQLRRWSPALVYSHGLASPDLEQRLVDEFPVVTFVHAYYGACISGFKRFAVPRVTPCERPFGVACWAHYFVRRCGGLDPRSAWTEFQVQRRRQEMLKRTRVLVASKHMADTFRMNGLDPRRVTLVPMFAPGIRPDERLRPSSHGSGGVLFVGRVTTMKGLDLLVPALKRAQELLGRQLSMHIVGDGGATKAALTSARQIGLEAHHHGWLPPELCWEMMTKMELLAVPSVWPEPFGLVGLEAASVGLPAVAFNVGGISEWLEPGRSGELAPGSPPTADGLTQAIVRALQEPGHYEGLRSGALAQSKRFSPEAHLDALEKVLHEVAEPREVL